MSINETSVAPAITRDDMTSSVEQQVGATIDCVFDNDGGLTKLIIQKPEKMTMQKWERKIIKIARGFEGLGVQIRRVSDEK